MLFLLFFCISLRIVNVQADLTCLGWGLISPIVGIFCHFSTPGTLQAAENHTIAAVEEAVQDAKSLVEFDLTHNPAVITYNFLEQTSQKGFGQGRMYLANVTKDFGELTIGFGKASANQIVQIYELAIWDDVSFCLIRGAGRLTTQAKRRLGKRAGVVSTNDAVSMAQSCISDKLKKIAHPAVFQINGTNQKVGSTISDIAALLVPVGVEEEVVVDAAEAVDLAIPGSESTTRIVKMGDGNAAAHFANKAEAEAVGENMKDPAWVDENCGICGNSPPPISVGTSKIRRAFGYRLDRRVNILTCCCRAPEPESSVSGSDSGSDTDFFSLSIEEIANSREAEAGFSDYQHTTNADFTQPDVFDPTSYEQITEADLVSAPPFLTRDLSIATDVAQLNNDLDTFDTGVVAWTSQLTKIYSSRALFANLRNVFTGSRNSRFYQLLNIEEDLDARLATHSSSWLTNDNAALRTLQAFTNEAIAQGKGVFAKLQGLTDIEAQHLQGEVEFFYTHPWTRSALASDTRGFHTDGTLQFESTDTPGLVIKNLGQGTGSRVPPVDNAFQLMKGPFWDYDAYLKGEPQGPTWWTSFGPEMAEKGQVGMRMHIGPPEGV